MYKIIWGKNNCYYRKSSREADDLVATLVYTFDVDPEDIKVTWVDPKDLGIRLEVRIK